ncbi:MAG: molybdopterin molybdotransferase MoeA [Candidatus Hydrogenedentes bacterium]|nr:molybdopterin molybdotransferase MoeA [Candidatus Hydrogenedentota bacterium]
MLPLNEAVVIVVKSAWRLGVESVPLPQALHRVLAADAVSDVDIPPFNKANMDGYACRRADAFLELRVVEHVPAGAAPSRALGPGECAKVMTGAPVPENAECILIVEQVEETAPGVVRFTGSELQSHISPRGEDVRWGDVVLHRGRWLQPQDLAVLASVGCAAPHVSMTPRVGIIATGDELVPPESLPSTAQIRNSNNFQLAGLVTALGGLVADYGIVRDREEEISAALTRAFEENDLVLTTGGVSMGDFDLVPGVLERLGFETRLRRVAIQPGKPIVFAVGDRKGFFGLSGNPVSSFVQFELLVKPLFFALQGAGPQTMVVHLPLSTTLRRKNAERTAWAPVRLAEDGAVTPVEFHGSAHHHALSHADGLVHYPRGTLELPAGSIVPVRLCRWG